ncbi:hypothetical protein [Beijerinckia sp. L45]|uniref:hypothetical protein n=1 Tax=Beijerinckia sp. L45 TaxID=1641855 RepID=UPI00131CC6B3|nr:hypothetical protein [Beijerinckia sp. L45]
MGDAPASVRHAGGGEATPTAAQDNPKYLEQRTYTGLLDDVMMRYSNDYASADFFNRIIAKNLFFGGGIYFNDGYLVNHPVARKALYNENSLLRAMLTTGFIRILTRTRDGDALAAMPQSMAKQNNASYKQLVESTEWPTFSRVWERVAHAAFYTNMARSWPNYDMSYGFTKLMHRAFGHDPANLGLPNISTAEWQRIRDDFDRRRPQDSGPRDKLEKAALTVLADKVDLRGAMNDIMTIGNQAYHYNFGLTLTDEEQRGVAVDTTIGPAFDELLETQEIEQGALDDLPAMWLPRNFPLEHGDVLMPLVSPGSDAFEAKKTYLAALEAAVRQSRQNAEAAKERLMAATERYQAALVDILAPRFERFDLDRAFGDSFTVAFGSMGAKASAAPTPGLAISIQGEATQRGRDFLIERFKMRDVTESFDPSKEHVVKLGEIQPLLRPHISSLAFAKQEAEDFVSDIPRAPDF